MSCPRVHGFMVSAMVPSFVSAVLGDAQDDLVCLLDVDEFVEVH